MCMVRVACSTFAVTAALLVLGCSIPGAPNVTPLVVYVTPPPSATTPFSLTPVEASTPTPSAALTAAPSAPTPVASGSPRYQTFQDLRVGDCFDPILDWDDGSLIAGVLHDCDEPHEAEVFAVVSIDAPPGAPFPGDPTMEREVMELCDPAFEEYVGAAPEDSRHGFYLWAVPLEESWNVGDRSVHCAVEALPGRSLGESVRGSRR
jgi:hypothetical protein